MSTANMDPEMLALLSDEERAAIEGSELSPEELAAMKEIAGDDNDGYEDEDGEQDDNGGDPAQAASDKGNADTDPAPAAGENTEGEAEPATALADNYAPRYQAKLPADFEEKLNGLTQESMELAKQFKEGDLEFDEYNQKISDINARRDELNTVRIKAEIAAEMNSQSLEQQWVGTVKNFNARVAKEVDYAKDEAKAGDLDTFVKALADKPENADKPMSWFLEEGHRRVKALHGIADVKTAGGDKQTSQGEPAKRKPPVDAAPKTLAQVPGSDGPGDLAGEFADLDNLEGMELEQAIARMSPAQRERYAQS